MNQKEQLRFGDKVGFEVGKTIPETIKLYQNVTIQTFDEHGNLKQETHLHNEVKTAGLYVIMDQLLASPSLAKPGWMELGTGTGGTTTLNAYIAGSRTALDSKTRNNAVVTMVCTFAAGTGTGTVTEAGIFNVVTENTATLVLYADTFTHTKGALDSLVITWTLTGASA